MFRTALLAAALCALAPTASAADVKICVIDAQKALNETDEGKAARGKLETMFSSKKDEIEKLQKELEKEFEDYEQRKMILSDAAKKDQERSLLEKQQKYQAMVMQAEQEMQGQYMELLGSMEEKLMRVAAALGAKQSCTVLLPKEATIYVAPSVVDLTSLVISDLNASGK